MSIEAMRQALEALAEINKLSIGENAICLPAEIDTAMDALRQAIEQAERASKRTISYACPVCCASMIEQTQQAQPVAWMWEVVINDVESCHVTQCDPPEYATKRTPLYTTPPQRKPLSDLAIADIYIKWDATPGASMADFARAIEAAHWITKEQT
jgi:hypothetical protein